MYEINTILALKDQRDPTVIPATQDGDDDTVIEFPYNRVRVIGPSIITHSRRGDEEDPWIGPDAVGVMLSPLTSFGSTLDEPFGKIRALYDVESLPEAVETEVTVKQYTSTAAMAGRVETPEEVFAREAPGAPVAEEDTYAPFPTNPEIRVAKRVWKNADRSPLPEPPERPGQSPLGKVKPSDTKPSQAAKEKAAKTLAVAETAPEEKTNASE